MGLMQKLVGYAGIYTGAETRSIEDPKHRLSENPEELLALLGAMSRSNRLPLVSIDAAMSVPAVFGILGFLPRTLATLPLHTYENVEGGARADDEPAQLLSFAVNEGLTSYEWRKGFWFDVFSGGRGLAWIERIGRRPVAIWPMEASKTTIERRRGRLVYRYEGKEYAAADVIDVPFMLKRNRIGSYSPIAQCNVAISLAIAMGDFAGGFFASGGLPPYSLEGPLPNGPDAYRRAKGDIDRAINLAREDRTSFFAMPPGYKLNPVGIEPSKGQMVEARLFQVQEICRIWGMPPVFVQDLSKGTMANTEQQDLQLVKHLIGQWAKALEDELTLKLYGWKSPRRRVKHNLDGLQRGDFKSRTEALARAIMTGQLTPDEARALENRQAMEGGDRLYMQGATVPLTMAGNQAGMGHNGGPPMNDNEENTEDDESGDKPE